MANNSIRNYEDSTWHNQIIDGISVFSVRVRIFQPRDPIKFYQYLIDTDGDIFKKSRKGFTKFISNFSYAIFSTGIREKGKGNNMCLDLTIYLGNNFHLSKLDNLTFLGKSYVIKALQGKAEQKLALPPLQSYFFKKIGSDSEEIYALLKTSVQNYDFDKVEQIFEQYQISAKYQALFWKEMYQETQK